MKFLWCTEKVLQQLVTSVFHLCRFSCLRNVCTTHTVTHLLVLDQTQFAVGLNWKKAGRSSDVGYQSSSGSPDSPFEKQLVCGWETHSDS